jgi:hypothetical protein
MIFNNRNLWSWFIIQLEKHNNFRVVSLLLHQYSTAFFTQNRMYQIFSKMKNKKNCDSKSNRTLDYLLWPYYIFQQLSKFSLCVQNNTISQSSSTSKSTSSILSFQNLNIKLMKCFHPIEVISHFHLALLNVYHFLCNILPCLISTIH